jgi:drug/metabolite transporter (DMT)-like permease
VLAVGLALCTSVSWGVGDFLGGLTARQLHVLTVLAVSQVVGLVAVLTWALLSGEAVPPARELALAAGAGTGGALGLAALYRGMAVGAMGIVAPISGLSPAVPLVVGLASGERPSALQLAGIGVALTGVLLVSREPSATGARRAAGVGLALVAAAGFGLYFVLLDGAADASVPWAVTTARATAASLAVLAAVGTGAALRPPARLLPALASVGLADVAANAFFGLATTRGLLSVVSVLASLYPVVTVVLARALLGERLGALQRVGGGAALAGAALIVAG